MRVIPSIIDVEASGFGHNSYPIEIGIAHSSGERFCTLIQPDSHWTYWDMSAEQIHHITRRQLIDTGRPIKEVAHMLNEHYRGQTLYSDGWVVDKPWISTLFHAAGVPMLFSVSPLEMILDEAQMECWHEVKQQVVDEKGLIRHRASNDAYIVQQTFQRTATQVNHFSHG
jgi:hypothetical protein